MMKLVQARETMGRWHLMGRGNGMAAGRSPGQTASMGHGHGHEWVWAEVASWWLAVLASRDSVMGRLSRLMRKGSVEGARRKSAMQLEDWRPEREMVQSIGCRVKRHERVVRV